MHWGHPNRDKVALFLGDIMLILLCAVAGWKTQQRAGDMTHELVSLLVLLPAYVAAIYVFDLYSQARLNGLGTFLRAILAVGLGSGSCYVFCTPFPAAECLLSIDRAFQFHPAGDNVCLAEMLFL